MARRTLRKMTWGWVEGFLNVSKAFRRLDAAEGTYLKEIQVTVWSDIHVRSGLNPIGGKTSLQAEQRPARHFRESHESSHPLRTALRERVVLLHTPKIIHVALCLALFCAACFCDETVFCSPNPVIPSAARNAAAGNTGGMYTRKQRTCGIFRSSSCSLLCRPHIRRRSGSPPPLLLYRWGWRRLSTTL